MLLPPPSRPVALPFFRGTTAWDLCAELGCRIVDSSHVDKRIGRKLHLRYWEEGMEHGQFCLVLFLLLTLIYILASGRIYDALRMSLIKFVISWGRRS